MRKIRTDGKLYWSIVWLLMGILLVLVIAAFTGCVDPDRKSMFVQQTDGTVIMIEQPQFPMTGDTVVMCAITYVNGDTRRYISGNFVGNSANVILPPDDTTDAIQYSYYLVTRLHETTD